MREELKQTQLDKEEKMDALLNEEEDEEEEESGGPSGLSLALNRHFHHLDRGGSLGGEFVAGLTMAFLSICLIFVNMQIVGNLINGPLTLSNSPQDPTNIQAAMVYADLYAGSILVSILGSLLIGIIANLPLVQLSTMGLFSSVLCLIGAENGLTYQNLLFVNLIAAVFYGVLVGVPKLRDGLYQAVPSPVRRALPAATGVVFAYVALQATGFFTTEQISFGMSGGQYAAVINGLTLSGMRDLEKCALIGSAVAILVYILLRIFHRKRAALLSLLAGTVVFAGISILMSGIDTANGESFINFGRVWLVAGSQASQTTPFADSYLTYATKAIVDVFGNIGTVLAEGADFSAYSGNTIALIISALLCYLLSSLFHAEGAILGVADAVNQDAEQDSAMLVDSEAGMRKALLCNAGANLVGPFLGVGGTVLAGPVADKGGKSGLSSIFAAIISVISLFVMVFPALFATMTYAVTSMNQWNYFAYGNGGFVYLVQNVAFSVADIVVVCAGIAMVFSLKTLNWKQVGEWLPALLTVIASAITCNIAAGASVGMVLYIIASIPSLNKNKQALNVPMIALTLVSIIMLILL